MQDGRIVNFATSSELEAEGIYIDFAKLNSCNASHIFCGWDCSLINSNDSLAIPISVSEVSETNLKGVAEWVEYFAAFFNREQAANSIVDDIATRYDCNARFVSSAKMTTHQKVLFASFYEGELIRKFTRKYDS